MAEQPQDNPEHCEELFLVTSVTDPSIEVSHPCLPPSDEPVSGEPVNKLFYGDNLDNLRTIRDEKVDLCYIDPPFNSNRDYHHIYNNVGGEDRAIAQAFTDTWTWGTQAQSGFDEIISNNQGRFLPQTIELIKGLHKVLKEGSLLAYLVSMTLRITEIHRVLKSTGSFYLHCDPTSSHYLKLIVDGVFCSQGGNFQNEIIWRRTGAHNKSERWGPVHDVIFFYTASDVYTWNNPRQPYMVGHVNEHFKKDEAGYKTAYYGNVLTGPGLRNGESGKPWKGVNPSASDRHWAIPGKLWEDCGLSDKGLTQHQKLDKLYGSGFIKILDGQAWPMYERRVKDGEGPATGDIWAYQPYTEGTVFKSKHGIDFDVSWMKPRSKDRLGYPTQKPEGVLERIIKASSNEGDVILDAYCGCGTTVAVAQRLKRQWIGMDITYQAIAVIMKRLEDHFGEKVSSAVKLSGAPRDMDSVNALINNTDDRVRKEFEKWAVLTYTSNRGMVNEARGADGGIDGTVYFRTGANENETMVFQVKSGRVTLSDISKLIGDMGDAKMATLITLEEPTGPMCTKARAAGSYRHPWSRIPYDKIQIVTVQEILRGKRLELPLSLEVLKKSPRRTSEIEQSSFPGVA